VTEINNRRDGMSGRALKTERIWQNTYSKYNKIILPNGRI